MFGFHDSEKVDCGFMSCGIMLCYRQLQSFGQTNYTLKIVATYSSETLVATFNARWWNSQEAWSIIINTDVTLHRNMDYCSLNFIKYSPQWKTFPIKPVKHYGVLKFWFMWQSFTPNASFWNNQSLKTELHIKHGLYWLTKTICQFSI